MASCEIILNICTNYIAEREQTDISLTELREEFRPFIDGLTQLYGKDSIQIYGSALGEGALISNVPEIEALTDYDVTKTEWYQGAVEANGDTYISPIYTDTITNLPVVTMCRLIPETGSFLAIDIKPSHFEMNTQDIVLPEGSSYFLTDTKGNLLYYLSSWNYDSQEFQRLVESYQKDAVCETTDHVSENVRSSDGIVRNIFSIIWITDGRES